MLEVEIFNEKYHQLAFKSEEVISKFENGCKVEEFKNII